MKTNQRGRECPAWCSVEHAGPDSSWSCEGERRRAFSSMARSGFDAFEDAPEVIGVALGGGNGGVVHATTAYRAEELAAFIEAVAVMPRAEARKFAANVRIAAAEAWPQKEAEAG